MLQAARAAGHDGHERRQLTKFKEKNRTAQKRYRERQKSKLSESEERVAELAAQLQQLQTEKVPCRWKENRPVLAALLSNLLFGSLPHEDVCCLY